MATAHVVYVKEDGELWYHLKKPLFDDTHLILSRPPHVPVLAHCPRETKPQIRMARGEAATHERNMW